MYSFYDLLIYLHQENGAIRFLYQGQFLRSMAKYNLLTYNQEQFSSD